MSEPTQIRAGETATWARWIEGFDSSAYTLHYAITNAGAIYTVTGTPEPSSGGWVITIPPTTTEVWSPGSYSWVAYVDDGSARFSSGAGTIEILPSVVDGAPKDLRTPERIALDAIDAVLDRRATRDQSEMSVNGRSLRRMDVTELLMIRRHYAWIVARQEGMRDRWGVRFE